MSKDTSCFATYKMETIEQTDIKNRTYYFYKKFYFTKKI